MKLKIAVAAFVTIIPLGALFAAGTALAQGVSSATPLCFCKITNDAAKYGGCAGQATLVDLNGLSSCAEACSAVGFDIYSTATYYDYTANETPCNWTVTRGQCTGPDTKQTSDKCKTDQGNWAGSQAPTKPSSAAPAPTNYAPAKGSVVGLFLPSGGVSPQVVIGRFVNGMLGIVGSIAFLMFVYAGFTWMFAQGDSKRVTTAKNTMIWATLGLVIIFGAYAIVSSILKALSGS